MQHKIFCIREFIKTESVTAVRCAFHLHFNIQPPTRKSMCRWNRHFEQIGCLFKGKSSGRPRVSEKNVRWIQESSERSQRKSTHRANRELGIPQPAVWRMLRRYVFNWVHLFESPCIFCDSTQHNGMSHLKAMAGSSVQCSFDQHRDSEGYHGMITITFLKLLVGKMGLHEYRCLCPLAPPHCLKK